MGGSKKKRKAMGFAAKMAADLEGDQGGPFSLPDGTEVALFVSPGPKELVVVERICNEVGMGTLVVLLNARLGRIEKYSTDGARELFEEEFEPVFHLGAAPQDEAPGCLLHRSYPGEWIMARKPKVGPPKTVFIQENRPTVEDCKRGYEGIEVGGVEQGIEDALENVSAWFK